MKIATTTPPKSNKYYLQKNCGGYSPCIEGNNQYKLRPYPGSVLPNCVGLATGAFNSVIGGGCKYLGNTDAERFYALAKSQGLEVGYKPRPGAVAVWRKGSATSHADGAGHVAFVLWTNWSDKIKVWQSGWSYKKSVTIVSTYSKGHGNWGMSSDYDFVGFIYNPKIAPYKTPATTVQKGTKGTSAKFVQWCLWKNGCYTSGKKSEVDGSFGARSVTALKAFQRKYGLAVDGIAGKNTLAKMASLYTIE